jgi:ferredoxin-NADP reductase
MSNFNVETVTGVRHWNDNLFSFTTTRDSGFRYRNGHFTMIGLEVGEPPAGACLQHRQREPRGRSWSSSASRCRTAR